MQRRDFLKTSFSAMALGSLPQKSLAVGSEWVATKLHDDSPIAPVQDSQNNSRDFNGDNVDRPHDILWDIDGHIASKGGEPAISEDLDVVIVGGGMAGLSAAYYLRDKKIALLEQDTRLGGNSKGELYKNSCYAIGAAYLPVPESHSELGKMLQDLNLWQRARRESSDHTTVFFKNSFASPFWKGATDSSAQASFKKVFDRLADIWQNVDFDNKGSFAKQTDHITFETWLTQEFGEIHPHLKEYFQLYGWSSFCGSINELSAFQYLGFIASETEDLMALPGGNASIAKAMVNRIRKDCGEKSLRSGSIVLRVKTEGDSVTVLYEDLMGRLKKIRARHAIMACPKFVAKYILPELEAGQMKAMEKISYRAYLVGNILTKKPLTSPSYELYCLKGAFPEAPSLGNPGDRSFTDVCFGSWAQNDQVDHGVMTVYQGIPYDGARQVLFNPMAHDKYKARYLASADPILKSLGLTQDDVQGLRLTRWGHAVPLSAPGLISGGITETASQSIGQRIHFANQDNWANPCIETAHEAALLASELSRAK